MAARRHAHEGRSQTAACCTVGSIKLQTRRARDSLIFRNGPSECTKQPIEQSGVGANFWRNRFSFPRPQCPIGAQIRPIRRIWLRQRPFMVSITAGALDTIPAIAPTTHTVISGNFIMEHDGGSGRN
jgi:hypothetical protein